jgi:hypothetical protein
VILKDIYWKLNKFWSIIFQKKSYVKKLDDKIHLNLNQMIIFEMLTIFGITFTFKTFNNILDNCHELGNYIKVSNFIFGKIQTLLEKVTKVIKYIINHIFEKINTHTTLV